MVTLLEGGRKNPAPHSRAPCSAGSQLNVPPQPRFSLHNQIKTSPLQTVLKPSGTDVTADR